MIFRQITQQVFVAKEWYCDARKLADAEALSRTVIEKTLGAIKQEQYKLTKKLKKAQSGRLRAEAGLKNVEKQAEGQGQKLHVTKINLATKKQAILDLKVVLQKAKEETQLAKEAAEVEKRAAYQLGMEETQVRIVEELSEVCRDYYSVTWDKVLNVAGVPADSAWRLPENVFYPPEIREVPVDAPKTSEQPAAIPDAIPIAETTKGPSQVADQGEEVEGEKGRGKGKGKKPFSKSKDPSKEKVTKAEGHGVDPQAKDVLPSQSEQKEDPPAEVQPLGFFSFFFFSIILKKSCILFLLSKTSCLIVLYYLYFLT